MRTKPVSVGLRAVFYLALLLLPAIGLRAQTDITIGLGNGSNSSTTYPCPIQDWYQSSRAQYLYLASELTAKGMGPGMINAVKFKATAVASDINGTENYAIKIAGTTVSSLSNTSWEPVGNNFFGPVANYLAVVGINSFPIPSGFFWNGVDNILVEVCNGAASYTHNAEFPLTTGLAFNGSHTVAQDAGISYCGTIETTNSGSMTSRPDIILNWTPAAACTGTPVPGTAASSKSSVCLNESFTLSLSGTTVASGLHYQWQSSTNNTTWTNLPNDTLSSLTTTQTASTYYRCVVTCTASSNSANSNSVQVASPTLVSGTFIIDKTHTTGNGYFASFNDAYDFIKCGINGPVVFNVAANAASAYNEQLVMIPVPGASATNTITFNCNNDTLAYLSTNSAERAVIKLNGTDFVTFNNLVIQAKGSASGQYGFGVQLTNDADNNTINGCTILINTTSTSSDFAGIVISASATSATGTGATNSDNNTISNNTIKGGYYGITMVASSSNSNANNKIISNTIQDFYSYGVYLLGAFNLTLEKNIISRPTRSNVADFFGVYVTNLNTKVTINANRITNPFGGNPSSTNTFYGIYFTSVDALSSLENMVSNNLVCKLTGSGSAYGIYNNSSDNVFYYHNTLSMDGSATPGTSYTTRAFYQTTTAAGIYFRNNMITINRGGQNSKYGIYFASTSSDIVSNYNNVYLVPTLANAYAGYYSANRTTLADWNAATSQDANSLAANPIYKDSTTGNYAPSSQSVNDRGTPLGITADINSVARSTSKPDMGAYEFTPDPCTAPPVAGTATVNKNPVCVGVTVGLGLNGNSNGLTQTYQWQYSTAATGPWTDLGAPINYPDTLIVSTTTLYYRAAVTCSGSTAYSTPVHLTVNPALPPNTYTVDKNSPASATNYTSFAAVKVALECGITGPVVFDVVAGRTPYDEQFSLDSIRGTSAVNTITFRGHGNTIRYSSNTTDERAVIKLKHTDHIIFDGLKIDATGSGTYGYGVQLIDHADSNVIKNCTIIANTTAGWNTNYAGIVINASDADASTTGATRCTGTLIDSNKVTGGQYSITLVGDNSDPLYNTTVTNNVFQDYYYYGIYLAYTSGTVVKANTVQRPTRTNITDSYSIYANGEQTNLQILENRITNPFGGAPTSTNYFYGVYFSSVSSANSTPILVANNIMYNINGASYQYGFYNYNSPNVNYYHNTIALDNTGGSSSYITRGFYQSGTTTGIRFTNNIITINNTGANAKYAVYLSSTGTEFIADHNDYYVAGGGTSKFIGYNNGDQATLAAWRASTAQDAATISIDPIYADKPNGNLTPVIYPLDNTGVPVGVTNDIVHTTRSTTTPDIGAYEIDIVPCTAPLNAGNAVVTPAANICMGTQITLDLANNAPGGRMTYQWQASYTNNGPWINISDTLYVSQFKTELGMNNYFRCRIVCSGTDTAYSTVAFVNMNAPLVKGLYTINPTGTGARNFTNFQSAVAALECGIAGWVTFDVVPGTYTERIRMHKIPGASDTSRVTFRSESGDPASVTLTSAPTAAANYVLKLDSASYVTYKNLTIKSTGATYGRVIELAGTTTSDSLLTNNIVMPTTTSNSTNMVGIYGVDFKGMLNVIAGNTITNGASGINFSGNSTQAAASIRIDSNTVAGAYVNGIYTAYVDSIVITRNKVNLSAPLASSSYGIYNYYDDRAFKLRYNVVNISNATTTTYGIYTYYCDASGADYAQMDGNKVIAVTGNTGSMYGLYNNTSTWVNNVNNVINISTTGTNSYGLYSGSDANSNYYNNTVQSAATSSSNNIAAYLGHASSAYSNVYFRNNIFSHTGGGYAMYVTSAAYHNSDYNTLYTSGTNLIRNTATGQNYTLATYIAAADLDYHSIVYKPSFVTGNTSLQPDVNNPEVWAIHGRGVQVTGNNHDLNGAYRPQTLAEGVPDMGAYEFLPVVDPILLQPVPAAPAPGITQTFMFGTDTVAKITWPASGAVPTSMTLQRYSGVKPPKLNPTQEFMYFYTDIDANGQYGNFDLKQYYVPSWQGTFTDESTIHLGRTGEDSSWVVSDSSKIDTDGKNIYENQLSYIDRYTGLKGNLPEEPHFPALPDSSNRGTRFWVGYGHHSFFTSGNSQNMVLYLSAQQPAHVVVKIHGTNYRKEYFVPANSVLSTNIIPKAGLSDARLMNEGLYEQGISIESDMPIVAYAHIYGSQSSGATMLLPVGTYGYEYYALMSRQYYTSGDCHSWFYVIADNDNTVVEITPSVPTEAGRPAKVPFTVTLNKGQVYQVMGAYITPGAEGYDLSGSKIRSITNADGKCYPVAVFSGNSRTGTGCDGSTGSSGDNNIQQNFPSQAWGMHYLTAPTSMSGDPATLSTNLFRVMVKDTNTIVKLNNVPLTGLINGRYYQYQSNTADYIEANQPVMICQYMASGGACPNTDGNGDPEMFYISPLEQGINSVGLYRNTVETIAENYLTIIIPTGGLSSLLVDGSNLFDFTYAHPNKPGYSVVVKRWVAASAQCIVTSDSAFTAITYGLGSAESYGFNAGTLVRNLNATTTFNNTYGQGSSSSYTCAGTPFKFTAMLPIKPVSITWELSQVSNLVPAGDVTQTNPVAIDSLEANGKKYYKYSLTGDFMFTAPGTYYIPMKMRHPEIESCDNSAEVMLTIKVIRKPLVDYSIDYSGCVSDIAELTGSVTTENNAAINGWKWNFADGTTAVTQKVTRQYPAAGTYIEELHIVTAEGCISDTSKEVVANEPTAAKLVTDSFTVCYNTAVTFQVKDPETGVTYSWYNAARGGAILATGTTYAIDPVTTPGIYYVEAMKNGCVSTSRTPAKVTVLPALTVPVLEVDSIGVNTIRFRWNAVNGASGYEVSLDNGTTWITPSSGAMGLEHVVSGLRPVQSVTLLVKVKGCEDKISDPATAVTLTDGIYIPNAFSPNGDGLNDVLKVYGAIIREIHFMVFNQWGEKVFESNNQSLGWDGFYKTKAQPSGVYIYVVKLKLIDGSEVERKGSVNLIR